MTLSDKNRPFTPIATMNLLTADHEIMNHLSKRIIKGMFAHFISCHVVLCFSSLETPQSITCMSISLRFSKNQYSFARHLRSYVNLCKLRKLPERWSVGNDFLSIQVNFLTIFGNFALSVPAQSLSDLAQGGGIGDPSEFRGGLF